MKKVLFIDRDGTIIVEPPTDYQVDSFEKLAFLPEAIKYLSLIQSELDYKFVMITNQDGLGTDSFPEDTFWGPHNLMLRVLESEGVTWDEICIDKTFPHENANTRKPATGLLTHYIKGNYNLAESFVLGDRASDIQLADNLGARGIHISKEETTNAALTTNSWKEIYEFLKGQNRIGIINRKTSETNINILVDLDGNGKSEINTGLGFFDHMLTQISKHGNLDLNIQVDGDLEIDEHHTIEDTALALGEAFALALGSKKNIARYGFLLPMDDCLSQAAIDF
ncbi:MAG: histidinol-phosphatase, partial [Saprospiraceae bacterium]